MIFKKKKKFNFKTPKNLYEKIKTYFSFLFLAQVVIIISFFLWYYNTAAHKVHNPSKIFNNFSKTLKNVTGFELNKIDEYFKIYALGVYYKIVGLNLEKFYSIIGRSYRINGTIKKATINNSVTV